MGLEAVVLIVIALIGGAVLAMGVYVYNGLVSLRKQVERSWANIDVILKQRYEEIPKLIQVVEQFVTHEKAVIARLVEAREHYGWARSVREKIQASSEMSSALKGLVALGEAYPELKSSQNFLQLQGRVSDLEESLADRREHYNETVTNLNTRIEQLPDMIFARVLGYGPRELYRVTEAEKRRPSLAMRLGQ